MKAVRLGEAGALATADSPAGWPTLSMADVGASRPDASWLVRCDDGVAARCSAWWRNTPGIAGERVGVIGHFAAKSQLATHTVLAAALEEMAKRGVTLALGPMDGSTWRRYRFVTERGEEPAFFLEPWNPADWPEWWATCGWRVHTEYVSALAEDLGRFDATAAEKARTMDARGVRLRTLDLARYDAELGGIFRVAREAFRGSYLYTALDEDAFRAQYGPMRGALRPELVTIAEAGGECVGFFFAIPDLAEAQRGGPIRTAIAKTFAALPDFPGLGGVLAQRTHDAARALGYQRMVHALIHAANDRSRALSSRRAREIRRYALFERRLDMP